MTTEPKTAEQNGQPEEITEPLQLTLTPDEQQLIVALLSNAQVCALMTDPGTKFVSAQLQQKIAQAIG